MMLQVVLHKITWEKLCKLIVCFVASKSGNGKTLSTSISKLYMHFLIAALLLDGSLIIHVLCLAQLGSC